METSKRSKNVPVSPIPFPIDPNSVLSCPHISFSIGRENFSPAVLSFVSYRRYHRRVLFLLRLVSFLFSLFFNLPVHYQVKRKRGASENLFSLTIFTQPFALQLDVASAWHYFSRLSDVIFHRLPHTLNVTPNRLIFRSRAGFSPRFSRYLHSHLLFWCDLYASVLERRTKLKENAS